MLRRRLADERDVPSFVVFGDASLRQMAARFPENTDEFSRISGVGAAKLEQYGADFIGVIQAYIEAHGRPNIQAPEEQPERARPERRLGATFQETRELLARGLSIPEITEQRGLAETTIIGQIERLAEQDDSLDLSHVMPDAATMQEIERLSTSAARISCDPCGSFWRKRLVTATCGWRVFSCGGGRLGVGRYGVGWGMDALDSSLRSE